MELHPPAHRPHALRQPDRPDVLRRPAPIARRLGLRAPGGRPSHVLANLYWQLGDAAAALPLYLDLLWREEAPHYRAEYYARAAQAAYRLRDDALAVGLMRAFVRDGLDEDYTGHYVTMLYYAALAESRQTKHIEPIVRHLGTLVRLDADSLLTRVLKGIVVTRDGREGR